MKKITVTIAIVFLSICIYAQSNISALKQKIAVAADQIEAKCIAWRRDIHQHPELGNREFRTGKLIAEHLKKLGLEVKEGVAKTGVVGILRGGKPGPCIALRSDM